MRSKSFSTLIFLMLGPSPKLYLFVISSFVKCDYLKTFQRRLTRNGYLIKEKCLFSSLNFEVNGDFKISFIFVFINVVVWRKTKWGWKVKQFFNWTCQPVFLRPLSLSFKLQISPKKNLRKKKTFSGFVLSYENHVFCFV